MLIKIDLILIEFESKCFLLFKIESCEISVSEKVSFVVLPNEQIQITKKSLQFK